MKAFATWKGLSAMAKGAQPLPRLSELKFELHNSLLSVWVNEFVSLNSSFCFSEGRMITASQNCYEQQLCCYLPCIWKGLVQSNCSILLDVVIIINLTIIDKEH